MDNTYSILFLVVYIIAWLLSVRYVKKRSAGWGATGILFLSYSVYAFFSIVIVSTQNYGRPLTLFPLVYLFTMLWISAYPIYLYDKQKYTRIEPPKNKKLIDTFTIIYIIVSFTQFPRIISNIDTGITAIMMDATAGADLYSETKQNALVSDGVITNFFAIIYGVFSPLLFFFLFYYLTEPVKKKGIIACLIFCILIAMLSGISYGQRTSTTMLFLSFLISYFAFKRFMEKAVSRLIFLIGMIGSILVAIPFSYLTVSRFDNTSYGTNSSIIFYIGQCVVNFDHYGLSANGIRYGDRTCNLFKQWLGFPDVPRGMEPVRMKYSYMSMDDSVFSTFVGDFTLDFGPIVAFLLFVVFSYVFVQLTKTQGHVIPFHKMILCYLAMIICMQGGMYLYTFSFSANLSLIAIFLFYLLFYFDYNSSKRKV